MRNQKNIAIILVISILFLFLFSGFGMMGFSGFGMHNMVYGYGNDYLCSQVGGIWCYFSIFNFVFMALFWIIVIVLIVWLIEQIQNPHKVKRRNR